MKNQRVSKAASQRVSKRAVAVVMGAAMMIAPAFAQTATQTDPVLKAMQAELERAKTLHLQDMQTPYFVEYRVEDVDEFEASADYGALTRREAAHQRILRVTVRIGDYKTDNSTPQGNGTAQLATVDDDVMALRYALWSATDDAYKSALRGYSAKQAQLKGFQTPPTADDFAMAKPVTQVDPLVKLSIDQPLWEKRVAEASGWYASDAAVKAFATDIQYSTAGVQAVAVNRYLVNSEGTVVRGGHAYYMCSLGAGTQAQDGMRLDRNVATVAASADQLAAWDSFHSKAITMLGTLRELRNAPVMGEDYHGPVLFSSDTAADVFNKLFVPDVEADKPKPGTTARTTGGYKSSYKSRVLPEFMNVVDDPLLATFAGKSLVGAYDVDDEGVPAQKVQVVSKGILTNYLIGREPVKDFPVSNGHGRAPLAQAAHSRSGVMVFSSSEPMPRKAMEAKLLTMARDQGLDAVYSVDTLGPELTPRLLYRVNAKDGSKTLVRGAVFDELDQRSLRTDILAAGDDPFVASSINGAPQTTIAPSILFGEIGVKRASQEQEKLPYYPPPPAEK
ncbi:MAG: metallopeptidase TldD-related protein [Acidobacteriaceae bacterium]|nr:metallopeptidase TldD-related protein [Acidobacteriaceae bacterium]